MQQNHDLRGRISRTQAAQDAVFRASLLALQASVAAAGDGLNIGSTVSEMAAVVDEVRGLANQGAKAVEASAAAAEQEIF